jgi:hypothetical protein
LDDRIPSFFLQQITFNNSFSKASKALRQQITMSGALPCRHGFSPSRTTTETFPILHQYIRQAELQTPEQEYGPFSFYWCFNKMDPEFPLALRNMAVEAVYEECWSDARNYCRIATKLDLSLSQDTKFFSRLVEQEEDPKTDMEKQILVHHFQEVIDIHSNYGLTRYLDSKLPCHCMAIPPACQGCNSNSKELSVCGRCKEAKYCSRDCQKREWKQHRQSCKRIVQTKERLVQLGVSVTQEDI